MMVSVPVYSAEQLVAMLASAVGQEKSRDIVDGVCRQLSLGGQFSKEQARSALELIARQGGVVGAAARLSLARLGAPTSVAARPASRGGERVDVIAALAGALGQDKSSELVATACKRFSFDPGRLSRDQALDVLDAIGGLAGLAGVTARFAKARLLLR